MAESWMHLYIKHQQKLPFLFDPIVVLETFIAEWLSPVGGTARRFDSAERHSGHSGAIITAVGSARHGGGEKPERPVAAAAASSALSVAVGRLPWREARHRPPSVRPLGQLTHSPGTDTPRA